MRAMFVAAFALVATLSQADRIILIPLDSRPAAGQFAQLIARMAAVEVRMPPYAALGRFTSRGNPEAILDWLKDQDFGDVSSVVVSADMIAYGGLIESRIHTVTDAVAIARLKRLADIRKRFPKTQFYIFSSIMRLTPTATRGSASWRVDLGRLVEFEDKFARLKQPSDGATLQRLIPRVPIVEIERYRRTRARNHEVQKALIRMMRYRAFDYLIVGQDDARPYGPHVGETEILRKQVDSAQIGGLVYFCEGIDQHANILISRALLKRHDWMPRVRIVYSDEAGKRKFASYESKPIAQSLADQLLASGARPVTNETVYDYTLYVNTPGRAEAPFREFLAALKGELDQGFPVAVADINLGGDGTADQALFDGLWDQRRMMRLLAYAGWNTAGNTMGTAIPAANVYLLARRLRVDPLAREVAQREFVLHRLVNDYSYHKFTRPTAYGMIDSSFGSREETTGILFADVQDFVKRDLAKHLQRNFEDQFLGKRFFAGTEQYEFVDITGIRIFLPWPRVYEVRLEFRLQPKPVADP